MQWLLVHQNFPGQFRDLAPQLSQRGHQVVCIGGTGAAPMAGAAGLRVLNYQEDSDQPVRRLIDPDLERNLGRGRRVHALAMRLREEGFQPDAVIFHSGWGEGLYLRNVWPKAVLLAYPELYANPELLGYGFDPDLGTVGEGLIQSMKRQNFMALAAIADSDGAVVPTLFQRDTFPAHLRSRFHVIHEGIDCDRACPYPRRHIQLTPELMLKKGDPVITFVNRTLEPLRGFRTLMRALPQVMKQHPTARVVLVGETNGTSYAPPSSHPQGYLGEMLALMGNQIDRSRLHVLGRIPYDQLLALLQISAAHVYFTYPYALSWSLLEAMSCGAAVVGSANAPVTEVIHDGQNGRLVPFDQPDALAAVLLELLADDAQQLRLGAAARATVQQRFTIGSSVTAYEQLVISLKLAATKA